MNEGRKGGAKNSIEKKRNISVKEGEQKGSWRWTYRAGVRMGNSRGRIWRDG